VTTEVITERTLTMPAPHPKEFRDDVVAVGILSPHLTTPRVRD